MTLVFIAKLGFFIWSTNINVQKIYNLALKIYVIVTTKFLILDKKSKDWFFEKIFLLADTNIKVACKIFLFFLAMRMYNLIFKSFIKKIHSYWGLAHYLSNRVNWQKRIC